MPNPSVTSHPSETWAEVRTHDHVVRYRRSGVGPSVLLLRSPDAPGAYWPELTDALAARFRLIIPEAPATTTDVARWLTDFMEGLGLSEVAVVAADGFCIPALELALLGADQVARVVLVPDGQAEETGITGTLATSVRNASVALLVVRRGLPAADALLLVTRFLAGDEVADSG